MHRVADHIISYRIVAEGDPRGDVICLPVSVRDEGERAHMKEPTYQALQKRIAELESQLQEYELLKSDGRRREEKLRAALEVADEPKTAPGQVAAAGHRGPCPPRTPSRPNGRGPL